MEMESDVMEFVVKIITLRAGIDGKSFLHFMCPDCVTYIQNVDKVLKAVYSTVEKNRVLLKEYKDECQIALKSNESKIGNMLDIFESKILAKLSKFENVIERSNVCDSKLQEAAESNVKGVKRLTELAGQMKSKSSFAEVVKIPLIKTSAPLIIIKNKQKCEVTKADLNKNVDPKKLNISGVRNRNNGVVVVDCCGDDEREKAKATIESTMPKDYEVKAPSKLNPRIKLTDLSFSYPNDDLVDKLRCQNPMLKDSLLRVVRSYAVSKNGSTHYSAVIETDCSSFTKILAVRRLRVGWDRCRAKAK
uniref:Uncharacterized protein n=1 Tax=Glossina brevipalpis TaxID=37001 RepID=A0A1A9WQ64_9MUSC